MMEPMLVPMMTSTGMRSSLKTLRTPMWARPRAPPPESTRATRGRMMSGSLVVDRSGAVAPWAAAAAAMTMLQQSIAMDACRRNEFVTVPPLTALATLGILHRKEIGGQAFFSAALPCHIGGLASDRQMRRVHRGGARRSARRRDGDGRRLRDGGHSRGADRRPARA